MQLEAALGLLLHDTEVKFLLYADDLVLLSSTEKGLQQNLALVEDFCQNWTLTVNLKKTKIMIFQKKSRCQENKFEFVLGNTALEHT